MRLTIIKDVYNPADAEVLDCADILAALKERLGPVWPDEARLYHRYVSDATEVTPKNEQDVDKLLKLDGAFYCVLMPQGGSAIVAIVIAVIAVVAAVALRPDTPKVPNAASRNDNNKSANNKLSARTNEARPLARVPDIYGQVRSYPDLIAPTYTEYLGRLQVESQLLCIGRGHHAIEDSRDGDTDISNISGASVEVYRPDTDIVSGAPYYRVGPAIEDVPLIASRSNSVDGITLLPANAARYTSSAGTLYLKAPNQIMLKLGEVDDFTELFFAGEKVTLTTQGLSADYSGVYTVSSVLPDSIALDNPAAINGNWSTMPAQTGYFNGSVVSSDQRWSNSFLVGDEDSKEFWMNIIAPGNLYKDDGKNRYAVSVECLFEFTPVNANGSPTGAPQSFSQYITGDTTSRDQIGMTVKCRPRVPGRQRVRALRTTPSDTNFNGTVVDDVKWVDLYAMRPHPFTNFGDFTIVRARTLNTPGATALKERKLNMLVTRELQLYRNGAFSAEYLPTRSIADAIVAVSLDKHIGGRSLAELDLQNYFDTEAEVTSYFGTPLAAEFCYTFDSEDLSPEESIKIIAQAVFCEAYRQGSTIRLFFEREQNIPVLLFNHRNKVPGSEKRTVSLGRVNDYDGVELEYVSPDDDAVVTMRLPEGQLALNPQKIETAGVRNKAQAHFAAWRAWQKIQHQHIATEFDALDEARLLLRGNKILVADNTKAEEWGGEVRHQEGLVIYAARPLGLAPGTDYTAFLQLADGTVQNLPAQAGPTDDSFVLAEAPRVPLVMDDDSYARTVFTIVESPAEEKNLAFLVRELGRADGKTVPVQAVNYDARYYVHDKDYLEHNHAWDVGEWGACSAECGGGTQERMVLCRDMFGETVADSYCVAAVGPKPATSQPCNTHECPVEDTYTWSVGEWGACSAECGGGTQTRAVLCKNEAGGTVADSYCVAAVGPKPTTSRACNTQACLDCRYVAGNSGWMAMRWSDNSASLHIMFNGTWIVNGLSASDAFTRTSYTAGGVTYRRGNWVSTSGGAPDQTGYMEWQVCKEI